MDLPGPAVDGLKHPDLCVVSRVRRNSVAAADRDPRMATSTATGDNRMGALFV